MPGDAFRGSGQPVRTGILFMMWILTGWFSAMAAPPGGRSWIRINQLGYQPVATKVALLLSEAGAGSRTFRVVDSSTGKTVFRGKAWWEEGTVWGMASAARLDFSALQTPGSYLLRCGKSSSPAFRVGPGVYDGIASLLLEYMRQQRCGFNPFYGDSCHRHDGYLADHPTRSGEVVDATGGWHDASDYLQYTATSAHATYQLLRAWHDHPGAWGDQHQSNGLPGSNHLPDVLDEALWGLRWLLKMNPAPGEIYNQVADDRDHRGFRLPACDTVSYGKGLHRPVYYVTGKPQGLSRHKNRTTGVASVAGKLASAFALGAKVLEKTDPFLARLLRQKATEAYQYGCSDPGATQTACYLSPYFYEEDNWVDDMELAAAELYRLTGENRYLQEAAFWGDAEPVTPWMALHNARHYQFYPFLNYGHPLVATSGDSALQRRFTGYLKAGLEALRKNGSGDPFRTGVPFIWCSNNLVAAAVTQARIYREITGDLSFDELEASLRDWLLGCNPWGTSMICGLPSGGDSPLLPHSSLTILTGRTTTGGLVDGPVYRHIFKNQIGNVLLYDDPYQPFQNGIATYHDDPGDYTSNEPTMDGTASLCWYFSWLESRGSRSSTAASPATGHKTGSPGSKNQQP